MISLQRLRYFVVVAEELHFTRAARRLYVDQGAVSTAIRQLERDLGSALFIRSSRRVELTAFGASLLPEVLELLKRADRLRDGAGVAARGDTGDQTLRVGLLGAPGPALCEILDLLQLATPGLRVVTREVGYTDFITGFASRTIDAIFMYSSPRPDVGYRVVPLWENDYGISVSRGHELAGAVAVSLDEIMDYSFRPIEAGEDTAQYSALTLVDVRDCAARTCAAWVPTDNVYESAFQGATRSDVMVATSATLKSLRPMENYGLMYVPVTDAPRSVTSIVIGNHSGRHVEALVWAAQNVAARISDVIPGTWPHPSVSQLDGIAGDEFMSL